MNRNQIIEKIKELDQYKKKFVQTYDLNVVLKNIDIGKLQASINGPLVLPHETKNNQKVCAIVGTNMIDQAKEVADIIITPADIEKYKNIKEAKKLAKSADIFIAQQNMMPQVARFFGRVLGPRKKMPNPKTGAVFGANADIKSIIDKLKRTQVIQIKNQEHIQLAIGSEKQEINNIVENIETAIKHILNHLPGGKSSIKKIHLKKTMSPSVEINI